MNTPAVYNPNYLGAFLSFLRVLATNVATALLPLFMAVQAEQDGLVDRYPTGKALSVAVIVSVLLTVINYFREGETRFGPPPNYGAPRDGGYTNLPVLLVVLGLILVVLGAVTVHSVLIWVGFALAVVGAVLLLT